MTFQDLRSGCCSTLRTPATERIVKTFPLQAQCFDATKFFDGTSHLHRFFIQSLT
ncbi:hypothetical protein SynA1524_02401 [Synechococcus sp. A15-24]|nr:hypothetical protein SynA1524_02161 [Synechococcus sp. A15-24]QNJ30066.1 hypothetical protein SynA1524_02401 [Synechococcus sp. A15-24]